MKKSILITILLLFGGGIAIAQSSYTNVLISSSGGPEEVSICVNPKNINQVTAGANITNYYYSTNGGLNWSNGTMVSGSWGVWGDPIVTVDTNNTFYYFHLARNPSLGFPNWIDRMVCQRSTNGGATYENPGTYTGLNPPKMQDKEGIAIDWSHGPRGNWVYITWTEFDVYGQVIPGDSSRIRFSRSSDGGSTWSPSIRLSRMGGDCIDGDNTTEGAVPCVGPNGEVYVGWAGPQLGTNNYVIFFNRSTDGGNTWLSNDIIAGLQPGGWDYPIAGLQRANGLPCTLCDVSNGPYRGNIYINYTDEAAANDHDVKVLRSTNGGLNWSSPIRVNDDPAGREQFLSWMAIDQVTGYLYCVFYDRRSTTGNNTDVYMARSTNGGTTWINERISESSFLPSSGTFFGDYIGISAYNGRVRPMWMRLVGGSLSVWTAIIDFPVGVEPVNTEIPSEFALHQNYPNPFNPTTKIRFEIPKKAAGEVTMKVYDLLGKEVAVLVNGNMQGGTYEINWDASDRSSGVYFYTLQAGSFKETKRMVITK